MNDKIVSIAGRIDFQKLQSDLDVSRRWAVNWKALAYKYRKDKAEIILNSTDVFEKIIEYTETLERTYYNAKQITKKGALVGLTISGEEAILGLFRTIHEIQQEVEKTFTELAKHLNVSADQEDEKEPHLRVVRKVDEDGVVRINKNVIEKNGQTYYRITPENEAQVKKTFAENGIPWPEIDQEAP